MILKPKEIMKNIENKYIGFLKEKSDPNITYQKLVIEAEATLKQTQEAGKNIANSKLRQQLESYAASCGLYIYEATNNYPNTSLDPLDDKIQQVLTKYGEYGELDVEEFLLSSLKKIDNSKFKDTVISVLVDKLAYYSENLKELEDSELEDSESKQLERAIACICQIAYLESLQNIIPWLDKETQEIWLNSFGDRYIYELFAEQIPLLEAWKSDLKQLDKHIYTTELKTIFFSSCDSNYDSKLAKALQEGLENFIKKNQDPSIPSLVDQLDLTERVTQNTHQFIVNLLKQGGVRTSYWSEKWLDKCHYEDEDWNKLLDQDKIDNYLDYLDIEIKKYDSIKKYLEKEIKGRFDDAKKATVFHEQFTFKDIYVSLRAIELGTSLGGNTKIPNLENWTLEYIEKRKENRDQVLCIEGEPGSGKSTFCRKLSDWILKHWHPRWTPIWIKLRDIKDLGKDFQETVKILGDQKSLDYWSFTKNDDWLRDRNTCFVFLLDGLDELLTEEYPERGWEIFLQQTVKFQRDYGLSIETPRHQILITTRSTVLQNTRRIPEQLKRIKIEPIDENFQKEWLKKWVVCNQGVPGFKETNSKLKRFLSNRNWVTEPLLLYLLASMWRDQKLDRSEFKEIDSLDSDGAKIRIYEELLNWSIEKQLPDWLRKELPTEQTEQTEQKKANFKRIIIEAGLCAIQSGGIRSSLAMLEERLTNQGNQFAAFLMENIKKQKREKFSNALVIIKNDRDQLHFIHKSFSEFFYAKRLLESLKEWTEKWNDREQWKNREEFVIPTDRLDWEIYDLLGFGTLTQEIVDFLKTLLKNEQISPKDMQELSKRLNNFYTRWFQGEFVNNELGGTLARKKMLKLQKPLESQGLSLGRRQIDVYTGLNVLSLLLVLDRQAEIPFYPCGKYTSGEERFGYCTSSDADDKADNFEASRILRLIGYSRWLGAEVFINTVGQFLEGVRLRHADLRGAELDGANLNEAYLSGVILDGANLHRVKLNGAFLGNAKVRRACLDSAELNDAFLGNADLTNTFLGDAQLERAVLAGANLRNVSLKGANLKGAYLGDADLSDANLKYADLTDADLSCANLSDANLTNAILDGANLIGSKLSEVNLKGIRCNGKTKWEPKELDKIVNRPYQIPSCAIEDDKQGEGVIIDLAAHLGATKARFCLTKREEDRAIIFEHRYPIGEFDDLLLLIDEFLQAAKVALREKYHYPKKFCLAVAGPITDNKCQMVNRALLPVYGDLLKEKLGNPVRLINDFVAVTYGINKLREEKKLRQEEEEPDFLTLHEGEHQKNGLIAVIGAATGLGESFWVQPANGGQAYPSEGGHADFAPQSGEEFALFKYILENIKDEEKGDPLDRVAVERIISGRGIITIYSFLRERERSDKGIKQQSTIERLVQTWQEEDKRCREFVDPAAAIAAAAINEIDPLCVRTMEIFVDIFAAEVANFARLFLPYGGLYIAGGIAPQIWRFMEKKQDLFTSTFSTSELTDIPVYLLKNLEAGLIGAAHYAATKM